LKTWVINSLRGRYAVVAGLVAIALLISALLGHQQLEAARQETSNSIAARNQLLERSRLIRDAVWMTRESLAAFLLDPDLTEQRDGIQRFLNDAHQHVELLYNHGWVKDHHYQANIQRLNHTLVDLEQAITELIVARLDITRQYPALALARTHLQPDNYRFFTYASLAITESQENTATNTDKKIQENFVQIRHVWTQIISNFRLYLANRLSFYDESVLLIQEKNIAMQYQEIQRRLSQLQTFSDNNHLAFQGETSLEELKLASSSWFTAFAEIKKIHQTDDWRTDAKLLRTSIKPRMEAIWNMLIQLDKRIETSANESLSIVTSIAERQTQMLWIFTAICLTMVFLGFFALERMILRPVARVARALKTEAENMHGTELSNYGVQETQHLVDAFNAMRSQVQARQVALEYHALHDPLTNLGNRNRLTDRLDQAITMAERTNGSLSLLMLDLNNFKEVNDTLGHPAGDQLLIDVGLRLSNLLRESDTIARLGGDEFAILLPTATEFHATKVGKKIASALAHAFTLDEQQLYISASVGITTYPHHGHDARVLIQRADIAMYQAKNNKTGLAVYDPEKDQHSLQRLGLMADLRIALKQDELDVYYQPQAALGEGRVIGMEALLRWNHPEHGFISPEEVIRLAEQTGLIHEIALWVLTQAVRQTKKWGELGYDLTVAVNLSAQNLEDDRIVEQVRTLLKQYRFPAKQLILEVTENAMMSHPEKAIDILTQLDTMGVKISVDDFGTGYSSLSYLKRLPVNELKIDKSFVFEMIKDENDAVIVRSTIDLAHNLGLKVVAEGVEDKETWDLLQILRCDTVQGYFLSRPVPAQEFLTWLKQRQLARQTSQTVEQIPASVPRAGG